MLPETAYHGVLGEVFAAHAETSAFNAYIDRPAMLDLAGDVAGRRVLDVGCGAGHHAAELAGRGADVVGIDGSVTLLAHARDRTQGRVQLRRQDLEAPLEFAPDASFDGVVCALVLHHIRNRVGLLGELRRVLRPGGWLLVSTTHPVTDWRRCGGSYFSHEWVDLAIAGGEQSIHFQRMPLETFLGELLDAGFDLERLVEPRPVPALRAVDEAAFEQLSQVPSLLAVRLRRP